jgi:hypothetical protein
LPYNEYIGKIAGGMALLFTQNWRSAWTSN